MRKLPDENRAVVSSRQLLPPPEAEDYLVRRRRKEHQKQWMWEMPTVDDVPDARPHSNSPENGGRCRDR